MRKSCWGCPVHALTEKQKGCVGCTCCPPVLLTRNIQSQGTCASSRQLLAQESQIKILFYFIKLYETLIMIQPGTDSQRGWLEGTRGVAEFNLPPRAVLLPRPRLGYLWFYSAESCRPPRLETPPALQAASSHAAPPFAEKAFPKVQLKAPKLWLVSPALLPPATPQGSWDPLPSYLPSRHFQAAVRSPGSWPAGTSPALAMIRFPLSN